MDALKKLAARCKAGVHLSINPHRDLYQPAQEWIRHRTDTINDVEASFAVLEKMTQTETIICLQFYPDSPVSSYTIFHHDLDAALAEALACVEEDDRR